MQKILASNSSQGEAKPNPKPQCRVLQHAKRAHIFSVDCQIVDVSYFLLLGWFFARFIWLPLDAVSFHVTPEKPPKFCHTGLFFNSRIFFKKQQLTSSIHENRQKLY
jgi:hypothetical protein